ncbi:DUF2252 domain-containing protein [Rathayibacter soli]|uniref:DUF2252 domain-containing protein n=1 Tax=Rathayibacter soli TaxID=3144168 RepID=UPI0027E54C15|nr:DUF2252 domain-containing protein [Glaciibacter superstes]
MNTRTQTRKSTPESANASDPQAPVQEAAIPSFEVRRAIGRAARKRVPRGLHAAWVPSSDRPDPVALLEEQAASRVPELVPIRYGRMMVSPFTFYRGAALIMASDLSTTPNSGIITQLCGDAHLSNFGVFGTPERTMIFDINDFDETLPGPWEWDLKRLAASFEIGGRNAKLSKSDRRAATRAVSRSYREQMREAAHAPVLQAWYDRLDVDQVLELLRAERHAKHVGGRQMGKADEIIAKARTKDSAGAVAKLVRVVDGQLRIQPDPPLIETIENIAPDDDTRRRFEGTMRSLIEDYTTTLPGERHPIQEYRYVHMARKVVGVGSVGTRAWVLLLRGRDDHDSLVLQAKEAQESVLERFLGPSQYAEHGQRVVAGQRLMQAASDIFLGWQQVDGVDGVKRDFYVRQLHDWKGSVDVDNVRARGVKFYARLCGQALARAHSRSGDRVAIAAYLGKGDRFDRAIADFSTAYADQNERDYAAFVEAVSSGRLTAVPGL